MAQKKVKTHGLEVETDEGTLEIKSVRPAKLAFVTYLDGNGLEQSSLALVGQNQVRLIDMRRLGLSKMATQEGAVQDWFRDGVLQKIKES